MIAEDEPITPDEWVVRLIWGQFLRLGEPVPVQPVAFRPRANEVEGISVFRAACLSEPQDCLIVIAPEKRDKYALSLLPVSELLRLGLTARPAKIDVIPGHAVIPQLNITAVEKDQSYWKSIQIELAILAGKNLIPPREI